MNAPVSQVRYERKFIFPFHEEARLEALWKLHPERFHHAFPERMVNNIYLDTDGWEHYEDNVDGNPYRQKCRLRWYGPLTGIELSPTLEFKRKFGLVGQKHSYRLPDFAWQGRQTRQLTRQLLARAELPPQVRLQTRGMRPTLVNSYTREYLVSGDGTVRLTIDRDVRYSYPDRGTRTGGLAQPRDEIIVELKYAADHEPTAAAFAEGLASRVCRKSKYVTGVASLWESSPP